MTSAAIINQTNFLNWKNCPTMKPQEIIVAKSFVQPDIKGALESLILACNKSEDRQKALELLASIEEQNKRVSSNNNRVKEYKLKAALRRPKTAHARIKGGVSFQQFTTAYEEDFPKKLLLETTAIRPPSTENIIARPNKISENESEIKDLKEACYQVQPEKPFKSFSSYDQLSTYVNDYSHQDTSNDVLFKRIAPQRGATASGVRCHNPHPQKEFLIWRIARESNHKDSRLPPATILRSTMDSNNFAQITDEQFNRVVRGNCRSTYQTDYLGGAVPIDQITSFYLHPEVKTGQKLKLSTQQIDFTHPSSVPVELAVPKDRYSSNKVKYESAKGIIPQVTNKTYMSLLARTTYDEDINDRAKIIHHAIANEALNKVDLDKLHNMKDVERILDRTIKLSDREALERTIQKANEPDNYKRKSYGRKPFNKMEKLSWISSYPGPL